MVTTTQRGAPPGQSAALWCEYGIKTWGVHARHQSEACRRLLLWERRAVVTHLPGHTPHHGRRLVSLMLGALGIVYGDIGTSPLYAMRECFHGPHAVPSTVANVLGVLSVICWS